MQPSHGARNAASTLPIVAHTLPISTNYITTRRESSRMNERTTKPITNTHTPHDRTNSGHVDNSNLYGSGYVAEHFRSSNFAFPQVLHLGLELGLVLGLGLGLG